MVLQNTGLGDFKICLKDQAIGKTRTQCVLFDVA